MNPGRRTFRDRVAWIPTALVAATVASNLWVLRAERIYVENLNDSSMHGAMVRWATTQFQRGRLPLDGWFPSLGLGGPQFHNYQSIQHTVTGFAARFVGFEGAFNGVMYLLLASWPVSVYLGARWLGWDRWSAAGSAVVSPLLVSAAGYGFEHSSYVWQGYGMWSMLFGMWLLPLAWGLTWQAVHRGRRYVVTAVVLAASIASHFLTSYLALAALAVWALVDLRRVATRLQRSVLVGGLALITVSWVVVPLVIDSKWVPRVEFLTNTFYTDSYGARKVLGWLVTGRIYDSGRLPVVSLLVAAGLVVCAVRARHDLRARALIGMWVVSLALYFGRPTLGPALNLLPGGRELFFHRFISGVHLTGIVLAGVALASAGRAVARLSERWPADPRRIGAAIVGGIAGCLLILPAWANVSAYDANGAALIRHQEAVEANDGADLFALLAILPGLPPGRVYAGMPTNWGAEYKIGYVPVFAVLAGRDVDAVGFTLRTAALATAPEAYFDETNPGGYDLLGIRYVLTPNTRRPGVPAAELARSGRHTLWSVPSTGYLSVVDTGGFIVADRTDLGRQNARLMRTWRVGQTLPVVAFDGGDAPPTTARIGVSEVGPPGSVASVNPEPDRGHFTARVEATRTATVLLKSSFHGRWRATVDGHDAPVIMVAPALVGVQVTEGSHVVDFRYVPVPYYPWLFAFAVAALAATTLVCRRLEVGGPMRRADLDETAWIPWASAPPDDGAQGPAASRTVDADADARSRSLDGAEVDVDAGDRAASGDGDVPMVSVVLPCLNEEDSVGQCVREALETMGRMGWAGEVVVVDNGCTDGSARVARDSGARVVVEDRPGYGAALMAGIRAARAPVVVMADADMTYDFGKMEVLVPPVIGGEADLVLGERLSGASQKTMPLLHRFVGTPVLSLLVRRASGGLRVTDSQSGFRAFRRDVILALGIQGTGMEFASEMLIRAARAGLRIDERPAGYRERIGESKLDTFADGWRHLRLIFLLAPHLLLVWPGAALVATGALLTAGSLLSPDGIHIGPLRWQPVFFSGIALVLGVQLALAGVVLGHHSSLTDERVARHFGFVDRPAFPRWCSMAGGASVALGLAVDLGLFAINVRQGAAPPRLAEPLAAMAQSLILSGASLAVFGFVYPLVRRGLGSTRPPSDPTEFSAPPRSP